MLATHDVDVNDTAWLLHDGGCRSPCHLPLTVEKKRKEKKRKERKGKERKGKERKGNTTPFGVNFIRSPVLYPGLS